MSSVEVLIDLMVVWLTLVSSISGGSRVNIITLTVLKSFFRRKHNSLIIIRLSDGYLKVNIYQRGNVL